MPSNIYHYGEEKFDINAASKITDNCYARTDYHYLNISFWNNIKLSFVSFCAYLSHSFTCQITKTFFAIIADQNIDWTTA